MKRGKTGPNSPNRGQELLKLLKPKKAVSAGGAVGVVSKVYGRERRGMNTQEKMEEGTGKGRVPANGNLAGREDDDKSKEAVCPVWVSRRAVTIFMLLWTKRGNALSWKKRHKEETWRGH